MCFADRLSALVNQRSSQLVLGLDPDPSRLWPEAISAAGGSGAPPAARAALAVAAHCRAVLAATAEHCVAVKPQLACFERLGAHGWAALDDVCSAARSHGLLVIADAKRGDIDVSAAAYAQAFLSTTETPFGPVPGLGADALTLNPLLGEDSLRPFLDVARGRGAGLFVLVRTSNPGAGDLQDLPLADGGTVSGALAGLVDRVGGELLGQCGLSSVGAVVGATAPGRLAELRAAMPAATFLLPGVGAQGGQVEDLAPAFEPGPSAGLVSVSRGIVRAAERLGGRPASAAAAEAERLRRITWELSSSR